MNILFRVLFISAFLLASSVLTSCRRENPGATAIPLASDPPAAILLFNGTGTSSGDVAAVERILNSNHLSYSTANSSELNRMSEPEIHKYRLVIVPGGNFIDIGNNLTSGTTTNIRNAIKDGSNYLGICAGGFFAGDTGYNSLNLTSGVRFKFYSAENQGIRKTAVAISTEGAPTLDQYWEDGPQFSGWGDVRGWYPDGTPAIVEGTYGNGWVILTGFHPEATAVWRRGMTFTTPVEKDNDYAGKIIVAALNRTSLSHQ
ncbi:MAG TPA: BPL-N domain-containing protein [Blastocatellia bacterium]|nr:BPL-N domain-containing protein [Blastocatellia bacterium]